MSPRDALTALDSAIGALQRDVAELRATVADLVRREEELHAIVLGTPGTYEALAEKPQRLDDLGLMGIIRALTMEADRMPMPPDLRAAADAAGELAANLYTRGLYDAAVSARDLATALRGCEERTE